MLRESTLVERGFYESKELYQRPASHTFINDGYWTKKSRNNYFFTAGGCSKRWLDISQ